MTEEKNDPIREQDASTEPSEETSVESTGEVEQTEQADAPEQVVEASTEVASETEASADESEEPGKEDAPKRRRNQNKRPPMPNVTNELKRLFELTTKYPEISGPLAQLAIKLGDNTLANRILELDSAPEERNVEYYRAAADLARKEGRSADALAHVAAGLKAFAESSEDAPNLKQRLLHMVRLGFAVLMFDVEDLDGAPEFTAALGTHLPTLRERFDADPFYHTLLAQAHWFGDREESEKVWEEAVNLGEAETTWNSRGTWYKEADKDLARAEDAYRNGLKVLPTSTLLRHNLGQVLMDRAQGEGVEPVQARNWLNEAESLLRQAHRHARRHSMRRHISSNIERARTLLSELPASVLKDEPPEVGAVVRGRVRNIKPYGAFLSLDRTHSGLLHVSEMSHENVNDPNTVLKVGDLIEVKVTSVEERDNGLRISLSRKAILPVPEGAQAQEQSQQDRPRRNNNRNRNNNRGNGGGGGGRGGNNRNRNNNRGNGGGRGNNNRNNNRGHQSSNKQSEDKGGMGSLGELLLAKLEEKKNK